MDCVLMTRGGLAQSKWWAVLFICMSVWAAHIEFIESLDSFINSLPSEAQLNSPTLIEEPTS